MKKLISKFKQQPLPIKVLAGTGLLWVVPFIESMIFGYTGWYDLPIHSLILLSLGCLIFGYGFLKLFIIPIGAWVINLFKKKK